MNKIDKFFFYYGRYVLTPMIIVLCATIYYLYIVYPESFVYECSEIDYYTEPHMAKGVFFFGIRLHEPFPVPQLSREDCEQKQNMADRIVYISLISIFIMLGYSAYKHRKKIKEIVNNEYKNKL